MSKVKIKAMLSPKINEIELIILLVKLLNNNWEEEKVSVFFNSIDQENVPNIDLDLLQILAATLYKANFTYLGIFVHITQLDVKELEAYKWAMSNRHAQQ